MKKITLLFLLLLSVMLQAQVGVNTTTPDPSSMLDITATNKGVLVPRVSLANVTTTTLDGTNTAATGLLIWNTNAATVGGNGVGFYFFNGTQWIPITQTETTDEDWHIAGSTNSPTAITDNLVTQGNVTIGNSLSGGTAKLNVLSNSTNPTSLRIDNSGTIGIENQGIVISNNSLTGTASERFIGVLSSLSSSNGFSQTGFKADFDNMSSGGFYIGLNNDFQALGTNGIQRGLRSFFGGGESGIGIDNSFAGAFTYTGTTYGVFNTIQSQGNGLRYGVFNSIAGNGTGAKYGTYTTISNSAGGTHYGIYSDVLKAGSYAGYFLGNVSIGTSATNNYLLPASRGTIGQIMQTDGFGNVTWTTPSTGTDDQNLITPTLVGTTLNLGIENGTGTSIDLAPLQDGTGTDDQTIDNFSLSGTTLQLSLENDGQPLQTVNLASINTDDQNLVTPTLVGTTLNLNIENGTGTSIDLAPLQDGTGTDSQTLALTGNNLSISGGNTVNLSGINTDDQFIDTFTLVGNTLGLSIQNDGQPVQTVNLASINTDDQNIQNLAFNAATNVLTVGIENGISQNVSLASLATGGDIQGVSAGAGLTGGGTTGTITVTAAANNGLNVDALADNIQLGGTLIENTSIAQGGFQMDFNLSGTGDFAIQDNGTDVFFVEDTGDIGIGTSNPAYPLHIVENVAATTYGVYIDKADNSTSQTSGLYIQKTGTGTGRSHAIFTNVDGAGTGQKYGIFNNINSSANGNQYGTRNFINSATPSFIFGTFNNLDNAGTGNQYGVYNGMRGVAAANLYGTYNEFNSPSVTNETAGVYNSFSDGTPGTGGIMGVFSEFSNSNNGIYYGSRNSFTNAATGTGTKYGTYNLISAAAGGTHYGTFNNVSEANGWAGYFVGKNYISDRLSIGVTDNPNAALNINKNSTGTYAQIELTEAQANDGARIRFNNSAETTNNWILFGRADNTNSDSTFNIFNNVSGNVVVVNGEGRVGIMRTPATNSLEVNGTASKTVAGAFIANSDSRLKKDITTISPNEALDKILKLRGVTYHWNDDKTGTIRPKELQMGFIAQEIAEVFPEKVTEDNLGYLQTAYGDYDPIVFQAIKALNDKIEKLETENATLKAALGKINTLEAKLEQMNIK